jgi:hypothetical protein
MTEPSLQPPSSEQPPTPVPAPAGGLDIASLLSGLLGRANGGGGDPTMSSQVLSALLNVNQQLLMLLREERQERNELRRKVEKLEAALAAKGVSA